MKYSVPKITFLFATAIIIPTAMFAQFPLSDKVVLAELKAHITYLSDDKLEGRLVGSKGEMAAASYIAKQMQKNAIKPVPGQPYLQKFETRKNLANPHATHDSTAVPITGHNVVAMIDNKANNTVVIGAHYDHLGYNEYGGSTYVPVKDEKKQVHNGADDNASGTAALMLLARMLKTSKYTGNNYLFIAFSGEEEGLLGSNYFVKHPTIDTSHVTYMINMDMLGRLDTAKNTFSISGTGTSPTWASTLPTLNADGLKIKMDASGTGPSDHTSFYNAGIPALHFFTGTHYDYHKPGDDEAKINYKGELSVIKYIYTLIGKLDREPKLAFTRTKEDSSEKVSFKVTLGIMPDYLYDGKGVSVDGVTDGRPAAKAGLQKGDIILQLGETITENMQQYMKALSLFSKGQSTRVKILRNNKEEWRDITF